MKTRNPLLRSLAFVVIAALLVSSIPVFSDSKANAASSALSVWTVDALTKVFQSTEEPQNPANQIRLIAAKNERRAAQIAVRSQSALTGLSVAAGPLAGPNGSQIAAANISARFVDFIHLSTSTIDLSPDKQLVPPGGGMEYPDRITNEMSRNLEADTTQPIWYSVDVPKSAQAGIYTGIVTVSSAQGVATVDVTLKVYDVTLPDPNESAYRVDNWFTSAGWGPTAWQTLERQFGVTKWSPEWWQVMDHFAKYMRVHRNNAIFIDPIAFLEPVTQIDNGNYTFDWSLFDRMVQQFIDAGAMKYLQGVSLYNNRIGGRFALQTLAKVDGQTKIVHVPAQSQAADQWLNVYLPALKNHLQQKGWLNRYYQSVGDEPGGTTDRQDNNWAYDKIHALSPGIRTIEALHLSHSSEFEGKLDTYVVLQSLYDSKPYYYQKRQSAGDEAWLYVAQTPTGNYLTRNIDAPLAQVLLPHWYTFKNGLSGYLHWGFNYWFLRPYGVGAQSVSASSSIEANGWSKSYAVDNVETSTASSKGWSSVSHPDPAHTEWIKLDLGAAKTVSRVMLFPYSSSASGTVYGFPKHFAIKLSENGTDWTRVASEADYQASDSSAREFNFPSHTARYVMVEATELAADEQSGYSMQLAELQIWNDDVIREADPNYPGDSWLVYPDKNNLDLFSSIRAETMLEGIQDHELLELLKNSGKVDFAYNIAESLVNNGTNYNMNLDAIRLARKAVLDSLTGQTAIETFVDPLDDYDFTNVVSKSAKLSIDSSNPVLFGGDTRRLVRLENTDQFVVYYRPNIRSFTAMFYSDSSDEIEVWGSADNNTWTPIDVTVGNRVDTAFGWFQFPVSSSAIPWGTNYLKIVIKGSNDKHWVPQLGEISITYGGDRVETPSLVANSGFEAGLWEPRTNAALDTAVKYSGNQSARITAGSAANFMSSSVVKTELGKKYAFSLRLKTEAISAPDGVKVELMQVDANGNDIGVYGGNAGAFTAGGTQDWTKFTIEGINALAAGLRVIVRTAAGTTGTVWVDDAVISATKLPDTFIDRLDTFDGIFERSDRFFIDFTNPSFFEGDKARLMRLDNIDQYAVYNGVNMSSFTATFYSEGTDDVDFYVSPDNATWTPLTVTSSARVPTVSTWFKVVKSSSAMPRGTNYLKIVFRDTNIYNWTPQLAEISFTYDYANAEYPKPVSLVNNSGFELGGWPVWQGSSLDTDVKHSGDISARLTGGVDGAYARSDKAVIDPQKLYMLSLWLKTDGVSTSNGAKVELMQVDENGNDIGLYQGGGGSLSIVGTNDWAKRAISGLGPFAGGTAALKVIVSMTPGASGTVWVDDVELREDDGSMPRAAAPTATPAGGKVAPGTAVALQSSTDGTTIFYSTDGTEPTRDSTPYTGPIEVRSAMTIKAIAVKDGMTDSEIMSEDYAIADEAAPMTEAVIVPGEPDGDNGWYTTDVMVTLNASDDLSGVARTEYRLNGGEWKAYEGAITITAEGENRLEYRSADRAGNVEETRSVVMPIDKTAPTIRIAPDQSEIWPPNGKMIPIKMTVDAADSISGINLVTLTSITSSEPDPEAVTEAKYGTYDTEFRLKAARTGGGPGRVYTITYTAVDKAGHVATATTTITVPHDRGKS